MLKNRINDCRNKLSKFYEHHNTLVRKTCVYTFGAVFAASVMLFGMQSALAENSFFDKGNTLDDKEKSGASVVTSPDETQVTTALSTVYATQSWWKADVSDYDFITFDTTDEYKEEQIVQAVKKDTMVYPNISFKVTAPNTSTIKAASPVIATAGNYGIRDISKEKYTIRNTYSGSYKTSNGFDMVCSILNAEMGPSFSDEALKAQAVAIYSCLRYCDANSSVMVAAAKGGYNSRISSIVKSVQGQMVTYNGSPINAVFSASTAGCSMGSEMVWGGSVPYLKAVVCEYDTADCNYGVTRTFSASRIKAIIESRTNIRLSSDVKNWFKIDSCVNGKYVGNISIDGHSSCQVYGRNVKLTGSVLRASIMGNSTLRSTAFDISYNNGYFTFTTYGYGHGVGLSQNGANVLATKVGMKYDQILKYYYSGVRISCSGVNSVAEKRDEKPINPANLKEITPSENVKQTVTSVTTKKPSVSSTTPESTTSVTTSPTTESSVLTSSPVTVTSVSETSE